MPYTTVGYKTPSARITMLIMGLLFLVFLNILLFIQGYIALAGTLITGFFAYHIFHILKHTKYEFKPDSIIIHSKSNKFYTIYKKDIKKIQKAPDKKTLFWRSRKLNPTLQEQYFTTSNHNLVMITRTDDSKIIISPRIIKKEILTHYNA